MQIRNERRRRNGCTREEVDRPGVDQEGNRLAFEGPAGKYVAPQKEWLLSRLELNRSVDLNQGRWSFHGWSGGSGRCLPEGLPKISWKRRLCRTHADADADAIRVLFLLVITANSLLDSITRMVDFAERVIDRGLIHSDAHGLTLIQRWSRNWT